MLVIGDTVDFTLAHDVCTAAVRAGHTGIWSDSKHGDRLKCDSCSFCGMPTLDLGMVKPYFPPYSLPKPQLQP